MVVLREIRRRARQIVLPVLGACIVVYFVYHTIQGDRGLRSYVNLGKEVDEAASTLAALNTERKELERRVRLLRPDSLDRDLLEERARAILNAAHSDDVSILLPPPAPEK
jgi:cell division protein FtsB